MPIDPATLTAGAQLLGSASSLFNGGLNAPSSPSNQTISPTLYNPFDASGFTVNIRGAETRGGGGSQAAHSASPSLMAGDNQGYGAYLPWVALAVGAVLLARVLK